MCKISKFWFAVLGLGGKQHKYYYELHRKYGDFVRVGGFYRLFLRISFFRHTYSLVYSLVYKARTSCRLSMQLQYRR